MYPQKYREVVKVVARVCLHVSRVGTNELTNLWADNGLGPHSGLRAYSLRFNSYWDSYNFLHGPQRAGQWTKI